MFKRRYVFVVIALLLCLALSSNAQNKRVIRVANAFASGNIMNLTMEKFKELLEERSGKWFEVQTNLDLPNTEEKANEVCSKGEVEMQSTGGYPLQTFAPQYSFFNAPYVMKDFEHFTRVWNGPLGQKAMEEVEKNGNMIWLGNVYRGLRQMTSNKPIYTVDDVAGLKLRLPGVATWVTVWKAMGANPVTVPLNELYNSLKDGRAEASEGDIPQIHSYKLYEVQSYLTITNHLVQTGGVLINKTFFESLSRAEQEMIKKAAREAIEWATTKVKNEETQLLVDLQKKGMRVIVPDAESFRAKGKAAVEDLFRTQWTVTTWPEVLAQ